MTVLNQEAGVRGEANGQEKGKGLGMPLSRMRQAAAVTHQRLFGMFCWTEGDRRSVGSKCWRVGMGRGIRYALCIPFTLALSHATTLVLLVLLAMRSRLFPSLVGHRLQPAPSFYIGLLAC